LRQRLEALLEAHEESHGVLAETPPAAKGPMKIGFTDVPGEIVGQKIGRYKILERVGEGCCGLGHVAELTEPVWDTESWRGVFTLQGHGSQFLLTESSPDGNVIGALSGDGNLKLWRAPSWATIEAAP
jgi:hypothetical protein